MTDIAKQVMQELVTESVERQELRQWLAPEAYSESMTMDELRDAVTKEVRSQMGQNNASR